MLGQAEHPAREAGEELSQATGHPAWAAPALPLLRPRSGSPLNSAELGGGISNSTYTTTLGSDPQVLLVMAWGAHCVQTETQHHLLFVPLTWNSPSGGPHLPS